MIVAEIFPGRDGYVERSLRDSRISAPGRSDRLGGVGFRFDMDRLPLSDKARLTGKVPR
jgi:hypothetical protein